MDNNDSSSDSGASSSRDQAREKPAHKVTFATQISCITSDKPRYPRLVERSGTCNVISRTITGRRQKFISDIFTTLLDTPWRQLLTIFSVIIVLCWVIFAVIYYIAAASYGDFTESAKATPDRETCVANAVDFISLLLFSMETQTTIGYGYRYVNVNCAFAAVGVVLQSILGAFVQALLTGMVIAKVQKPKKRSNTILFSKNVCILDDKTSKYLTLRVGDLQRTEMIDAHARAVLVTERISRDGDFVSHFRYDLDLWSDMSSDRINLRWPCILRHRVTPCSPFWEMNEEGCLNTNFELLIFLEGIIETTGMTVSSRTSYLPRDFLWDQKFKPMTARLTGSGQFDFDFSDFHATVPANYAQSSRMRRKTFFVRKSSPTDSSYSTGNGDDLNDSDKEDSKSCEWEDNEEGDNYVLVVRDGRVRKVSTESNFMLCSDDNLRRCKERSKSTSSKISSTTFDNLNYYSE